MAIRPVLAECGIRTKLDWDSDGIILKLVFIEVPVRGHLQNPAVTFRPSTAQVMRSESIRSASS